MKAKRKVIEKGRQKTWGDLSNAKEIKRDINKSGGAQVKAMKRSA